MKLFFSDSPEKLPSANSSSVYNVYCSTLLWWDWSSFTMWTVKTIVTTMRPVERGVHPFAPWPWLRNLSHWSNVMGPTTTWHLVGAFQLA